MNATLKAPQVALHPWFIVLGKAGCRAGTRSAHSVVVHGSCSMMLGSAAGDCMVDAWIHMQLGAD